MKQYNTDNLTDKSQKHDLETAVRNFVAPLKDRQTVPMKTSLADAIRKSHVTQSSSDRLLVVSRETSLFSRMHLFITSLSMQKTVAIGAASTLAVVLLVGSASYMLFERSHDAPDELSWVETSFDEDFADLDAFLSDDISFEDDLLAFSDLDTGVHTSESDLDALEAELNASFDSFEQDQKDLNDIGADDSSVDGDLGSIS